MYKKLSLWHTAVKIRKCKKDLKGKRRIRGKINLTIPKEFIGYNANVIIYSKRRRR